MNRVQYLARRGFILACSALGLLSTVASAQEYLLQDQLASPGGSFSLEFLVSSPSPLGGFSVAITYSNTDLTLNGFSLAGSDLQQLLGSPEYTVVDSNAEIAPGIGWAAVASVFDFLPPFDASIVMPASNDLSYGRFSFGVTGGMVGNCTEVEFNDQFGVTNILVPPGGATGIVPTLSSAEICFVTSEFIRGDSNGDGLFNGLIDGLFSLNFQFSGGATPGCMDAADCDGNDNFNAILDALFGLAFQFNPGSSAPPAPGPATCGPDVGASIGCVDHPCP